MGERISHALRRQVRERQAYRCALCGEQHPPGSAGCISVHHIKPRKHGGSSDPGNLVGLCRGEGTRNCHDTVDMLTMEHGIRFEQIMEEGVTYWVGQFLNQRLRPDLFLPQAGKPLYPTGGYTELPDID